MLSWRFLRLLLCIVMMLGAIVAGTYARVAWGVREHPYGYITALQEPNAVVHDDLPYTQITSAGLNGVPVGWDRTANPFEEIHHSYGRSNVGVR
jgi:hypothetical protein